MTETWNLLLVDDNPLDMANAKSALLRGTTRRILFHEAHSATEGLRLANELGRRIDCVVLDFDLPDYDAPHVLENLPRDQGIPLSPTVVVTGSTNANNRAALRAGAQDYLGKDWLTPESIVRSIENAIERFKMTTELALSKRLLERSAEFNRAIVEGSPDCVMLLDRDGVVRGINPAGRKLFEIEDEKAMVGRSWLDLWSGADHEAAHRALDDAARSARGRFQGFRRTVHGAPKWFDVIVSAIPDVQGNGLRYLKVSRDITAAKLIENKVREREEELSLLTALLPNLVAILDAEGGCVFCNAGWVDYLGRSIVEEKAGGDTVEAGGAPEAELAELRRHWRERARHGAAFEFECRLRGKAGAERWFLCRGVPAHGEDGRITKWYSTCTDIHDLKQAREDAEELQLRQRLALEAGGTGTFFFDRGQGSLSVSSALRKVLGLAAGSAPIPLDHAMSLVDRDDLPAIAAAIEQAKASGGEFEYEFRLKKVPEGQRWLAGQGRVFFDESGKVVSALGFALDVTRRKELERSLAAARAKIEEHAATLEKVVAERTASLSETVAELESVSYSISHDMRQPLRSMQQYSQILLEDHAPSMDSEAKTYLERIARGASRLDRLIQDVLTLSRVSRLQLDCREMDLDRLVQDIIQQYPALEQAKDRIQIRAPLGRAIGADAILTQMLSNLLGNAVRFAAPERDLRIELWTEKRGPMLRLVIRDNGIGIAADHLERIWKIFERVDNSREGTGIGLSIVRRGAERLKGSAGVDSSPGAGSTFWIELPDAS